MDTSASKNGLPGYGYIWRLSLPIILAAISETVVEVTDTIFLARYGTTELAAVGLAASVLGVALFLSLGIVEGMQITMSRRMGEGREQQVGEVFDQGLYLLGAASLLAVAAVLTVPPLLGFFLASADVHNGISDYLCIAAFGLVFQSVNFGCSVFFVAVSRTRVLVGATIVLAAVNILLDYLLIFGSFGFPELGIAGAAIGSLCAEVCVSIYFFTDILRRKYTKTFGLLRFPRLQRTICRHLISISWPVSLEVLVEMGKWFVFFLIAERLGEYALGIVTISYSCYLVLLIPVDSFAETACSLGSNLIGRGQKDLLTAFMRRMISLAYLTIAPLLLLALLWPEVIIGLFTADTDMTLAATGCLTVIAVAMLLAVPGEMLFAVLEGTGDTFAMLVIQSFVALSALTVASICGLFLSRPPVYLWGAEICGWLMCLMLTAVWLSSGRWQRLEV